MAPVAVKDPAQDKPMLLFNRLCEHELVRVEFGARRTLYFVTGHGSKIQCRRMGIEEANEYVGKQVLSRLVDLEWLISEAKGRR